MKIGWTKVFTKSCDKYCKNDNKRRQALEDSIKKFKQDIYDPSLQTHKLHGVMKGLWAFYFGYDDRVIFKFEKQDEIVLIKVIDHDDYS